MLTEDALARKVEAFDSAGRFRKKLGLKVVYHNHGLEFKNSVWEMRRLLSLTDPELKGFLLDANHTFQGGADVPAFLKKDDCRTTPARFRDGKQVALGSGASPLAQVAAAVPKTG